MDTNTYERAGPAFIGRPFSEDAGKAVILCGWMDGHFKHVEKYAHFYRTNGYTAYILLSAYPDIAQASNQKEDIHHFNDVINHLEERNFLRSMNITQPTEPKATAVVHVFSNGGCIKLRHLLHSLHAQNKSLKSAAVILDSCPGSASAKSGASFLTVGLKNGPVRTVAKSSIFWFAFFARSVNWFFTRIGFPLYDISKHPIEVSAPHAVSQLNAKGNLTGPRLFLYSDADELCAMDEVQGRIEACKAEGIVTEEKLFIGSPHVKHAVVHKEEYWSLVSQFLSRHE